MDRATASLNSVFVWSQEVCLFFKALHDVVRMSPYRARWLGLLLYDRVAASGFRMCVYDATWQRHEEGKIFNGHFGPIQL